MAYDFTATIYNGTPPEWGVTIIAQVLRYINSDGSTGQITAGNINLASGESHTTKHSGKCIVGINETILVRYDGKVEEFRDNIVVPEGECATELNSEIGPARSLSDYELSIARQVGLSGFLSITRSTKPASVPLE